MRGSNALRDMDISYHAHSVSNWKKHEQEGPFIVTGGEGIYIKDQNGKMYIEGLAGLWCTSLGFSNKRLADAAARQLERMPYYPTYFGRTSDTTTELAAKLVGMAPVPMSKVFFCNSGSEANDTAVKLMWYYNNLRGRPEKKKIISRIKGYHGTTIVSGSLTGLPIFQTDFDLPIPRVLHTDCPHLYRFGQKGESEAQFLDRIIGNLESLIEKEGADTIAGMFAEPIMAAGGIIVPPEGYYKRLQEVLKKHDILFLADEVVCGFARTGNMFGSQTFDLKPDFITVAKALSSAYLPIAGLMFSDPVYQVLKEGTAKNAAFGHGFTYSGHPAAAAVAMETLKIYEETDILGHVRSVQDRFQSGLRKLSSHPLVGEVRGMGLIAGLEIVADKKTHAQFDPVGKVGGLWLQHAMNRGLVTRVLGDTIALCPPLIITAKEVDDLVAKTAGALDDTLAQCRKEGLVS